MQTNTNPVLDWPTHPPTFESAVTSRRAQITVVLTDGTELQDRKIRTLNDARNLARTIAAVGYEYQDRPNEWVMYPPTSIQRVVTTPARD